MLAEGADDDKDGSLGPPRRASARRGGRPDQPQQRGRVSMKLWSSDKDSQRQMGYQCVHDAVKRVLFAKMEGSCLVDEDGGATKGALETLLDVAEACNVRKITLGLGPRHAGCAELICSLLYLGFQVVPLRKSPLAGTALLMELNMGLLPGGRGASDYTCTATSECSTSAEDEAALDPATLDSD